MKTVILIRHSEPLKDRAMPTEELPLSEAVGEGADEDRGQCRGNGAGGDHQRDIRCRRAEDLVDKDVEIHILHDPGDLPDQGEEGEHRIKDDAEQHEYLSGTGTKQEESGEDDPSDPFAGERHHGNEG